MRGKEEEKSGGDNTAIRVQPLQQRPHLLRPITAANMLPLLMLSALLRLILLRFLISCCCSCNGVVVFAITVGCVVTFLLFFFLFSSLSISSFLLLCIPSRIYEYFCFHISLFVFLCECLFISPSLTLSQLLFPPSPPDPFLSSHTQLSLSLILFPFSAPPSPSLSLGAVGSLFFLI